MRKFYNAVSRRAMKPLYNLTRYITLVKTRLLDIQVGKGNQFLGVPFFKVRGNAIIKIGNKNSFRSWTTANAMGLNHQVMITCIAPKNGKQARLTIGNKCGFSGTSILCMSEITIGDNVRVGANSTIMDGDGHYDDERVSPPRPIIIEDNVFIGANCVVKKGVHIGKNSVIGMNSLVTEDIPANCIAMGNPARPIAQVCSSEEGGEVFVTSDDRIERDEELHAMVGELLKREFPQVPLHEQRLIDDHHVDSMTQMSIVATLSEHFGVNISFEHVTPANFNSHESMTLLIQRLKKGTTQTVAKTENGIKISIEENPVMKLESSMAEKPVVQLILEQAKATPEALAIVLEGTEVTYRRMGATIYASFRKLRELGVSEGDYVCLHGLCSEYYLAAFYATQLIGAVAVPLEKAVGVERVHEIAEDVSAKLIVAGSDLKKELEQAGTAFNVISLDDFASLSLDEAIPYETFHYPKMSSPCHVLYTTGSTGKSKGVVVSHKTFSWAAYSCIKKNKTRQRTVSVTAFPLNHLAGLYCVSRNMSAGLTTLVFDGLKDVQRFFELFDKYQVNYIGLAPSLLKMLVQVGKQKLMQVSERVYGIACGSEPLPLATMKEYGEVFPNAQMQNIFGSSELGYVCAADCNSSMGEVPVGTPMEGVTIGLKDEDGKIHTENDFMGLICVKTPMLMEGYFNMPELTASVIQDGWFVMSDLGYKDKDGVLYHRGRADDVIIVAGFKVSPLEVEGEALNSGLVSECVCTSSKDRNGVVSLRLIVVPLDPARYDESELRKYLTAHMEAYRVPKTIETTDALKRTFNGKLDRKAYRE